VQTMDRATRRVVTIAAVVLGAGLSGASVLGQSAPAGAAPPPPQSPLCVMHAAGECRLPDGHPDLTGLWVFGGPNLQNGLASAADDITFAGRGNTFGGFDGDGGLYRQSQVDSGDVNEPNFPKYKPEYWDKITDLEYNGNFEDPQQYCMPPGLPRIGAPAQIISLKDIPLVLLFYNGGYTSDLVRQIWTDGRPHNATLVAAETWYGDSVGHWDGDTLVIESVGFTDASWLHKNGYIHGFNMKVTERLTRTGNTMKWDVTVDDPDYFLQPWHLTPVTRTLVTDPNATLYDALPCVEIDSQHTTSHTRST